MAFRIDLSTTRSRSIWRGRGSKVNSEDLHLGSLAEMGDFEVEYTGRLGELDNGFASAIEPGDAMSANDMGRYALALSVRHGDFDSVRRRIVRSPRT